MPTGDDLAIILFLWASALAVGLFILDATHWKHPFLIPGLITLLAVLILAGVVWVPVKDGTITAEVMGRLTAAANSPWAWAIVGIACVAMVCKILPDISRRVPSLQKLIDPRYIALREAALRLYERVSREAPPNTKRQFTDQEVLAMYASIVVHCDPVRVFGKRPPSRDLLEIPKTDYEHLFVGPDATTLQTAVLSQKPIYTDVSILASDYRKHIAKLQLDPAEWPIH